MKHLLILSAFMFLVGCESERISQLENDVKKLESDVENFTKMFKGIINGDKNSISLHNSDGKEIVYLGESIGGNGFLQIYNSDGKLTAYLGTGEGGDGILRTHNSDGKLTTYLGTGESGNGILGTHNSDGKQTAYLGTGESGYGILHISNSDGKLNTYLGDGYLRVYNKAGETVGYFGANNNNDGIATLYDRYGDAGWGVSGKK